MNNFGEENKEEVNNTPEGSEFDKPIENVDAHPVEEPAVSPEQVSPTEPVTPAEPVTTTSAFSQSTPVEPVAPIASAPAPVVTKKSHKGLIATVVALVVLLLAAGGYIAYLIFFAKGKDDAKTTTPSTSQQAAVTPNAQAVVDTIRTAITDKLASTYPQMTLTEAKNAPAYKADNAEYYVASRNLGHGLDITPETTTASTDLNSSTKVEQVIADSFTTQGGFTKSAIEGQTTYQNNDVICNVSVSQSPVSLSCADKSIYNALVTTAKPFATAYLASSESKQLGSGSVYLYEPKITQKADGYSMASVPMGTTQGIGGFSGLFYAKDNAWTFWQGTQSELDCSAYNTHDLQKAFEGENCYDTTTKNEGATVKVTL